MDPQLEAQKQKLLEEKQRSLNEKPMERIIPLKNDEAAKKAEIEKIILVTRNGGRK